MICVHWPWSAFTKVKHTQNATYLVFYFFDKKNWRWEEAYICICFMRRWNKCKHEKDIMPQIYIKHISEKSDFCSNIIALKKSKRGRWRSTYCLNSMLIIAAAWLAIIWKAAFDKTMVVPFLDGGEFSFVPRSTTFTWIILFLIHAFGVAELRHLTKYCLPQDAPLFHIPSPAAANRPLAGNCPWSSP